MHVAPPVCSLLFLDRGRVAETGTFAELTSRPGSLLSTFVATHAAEAKAVVEGALSQAATDAVDDGADGAEEAKAAPDGAPRDRGASVSSASTADTHRSRSRCVSMLTGLACQAVLLVASLLRLGAKENVRGRCTNLLLWCDGGWLHRLQGLRRKLEARVTKRLGGLSKKKSGRRGRLAGMCIGPTRML